MSINCNICGQIFTNNNELSQHIQKKHSEINTKDYYNKYLKKDETEGFCKICGKPTKYYGFSKGYADCCGIACSNKYRSQNAKPTDAVCLICNKIVFNAKSSRGAGTSLTAHISNIHNLTQKEYYDQYIRKNNEGKCAICGKDTEFRSITLGYAQTCSMDCGAKLRFSAEDSIQVQSTKLSNIRAMVTKMAMAISEKYKNFLKTDKHSNVSDIQSQPTRLKHISNTSEIETETGVKSKIETEISVQTNQNSNWIGSQDFRPTREHCNRDYKSRFIDDLNDDQQFSSNEWC